jgi:ATP-binding cassette subfamily B protein
MSALKERLRRLAVIWSGVFRLLRYSGKWLSVAVVLVTLAEVGFTLGALWITKLLVDELAAVDLSEVASADIYGLIFVLGVATIISFMSQSLGNYLRQRQGMLVSDQVNREIHDRALAVDLAFYESPAYYDSLQRARQAGTERPAQLITTALGLLKSVLFLVGVLALLVGLDWRLLPILLGAVLVGLVVQLYFTRRLYEWQQFRAPLERRAAYFDWLLTSDHHAKELRLFGLGGYFRDGYSTLRRQLRGEQLKIEATKAVADSGAVVVGALAFISAFFYLVERALSGDFALGDLVLFVLLFRRAESSGRDTVGSLSRLYADQLYLSQLFSFLGVEPELTVPARPLPIPPADGDGLRIENVDFTYPRTERQALHGVDMHIPHGGIVALLGENGSGKTTLIKLLTRLYDPVAGRVTLDGQDVRQFDLDDYRRQFSVIFQDFSKYAATVEENIWFGDARQQMDPARVRASADKAGAQEFIDTLPHGFDTKLTRLFDDGTELSVGQWQRIALARAFLPDSRFVVMDEPTSAVDPAAEMELFDALRDRLDGRAALVISHRLLITRYADYIYVLDKGRIVEHGTHAALLKADGKYADLFRKQGRFFGATG